MRPICFLTIAVGIWGCSPVERSDTGSSGSGPAGARLYSGLDRYHKPITTVSDDCQRWFDQGLQLVFGFNHDEAIRSFREAALRDPRAAMPWWGVALASGMNINDTQMTEERWKQGHEAARRALSLLDEESELERALVEAIGTRYTWPAPQEQRVYDERYAEAMKSVYERFADDPDVGTLFAESLMDLQPWDYWTDFREPRGRTLEIIAAIEHALAIDEDHPGACHLYIHVMEAGPTPEKAVPFADRLLDRVPGAGHLVHMPSHIYARVGRYGDAADVNDRAVDVDQAYLAVAPTPGLYLLYYAHNLHFLAYASMMEGRYEPAMEAARVLQGAIPDEVLDRFAYLIEGILPTNYHVMIRFGRWHDVLAEPVPAENRPVSRAVHHYARSIANSALGRTEAARDEKEAFERAVAKVPQDWFIFNNRVHDVLPIARAMIEGELAFRESRLDDAWNTLREGIEAEDRLIYDEPPAWMLPVRHAMGALLMSAGETGEAETLYREDQLQHPGNTWSLLGLKLALEAQGKKAEAVDVTRRLDVAWRRVETRPTSSCLCEPGQRVPAAKR